MYDIVSDQWICGFAPKRQRTGEASDGDTEMLAATPPTKHPAGKGGKGDKGGKGGKGGGKRKAPLKGGCWSCGGPHFQVDCPLGPAATPLTAAWAKPANVELLVPER